MSPVVRGDLDTARRPEPAWARRTGRVAGAVLLLAILVAGAALLVPVFSRASSSSPVSCPSHLKQLAVAARMYASDWDDRLPAATAWQTELMPYVKSNRLFVCPSRPTSGPGYAYNQLLDRVPVKLVPRPNMEPLIFESSLGIPNATDQLQSWVAPHQSRGYVAFLDTHVAALSRAPKADAGIRSTHRRRRSD